MIPAKQVRILIFFLIVSSLLTTSNCSNDFRETKTNLWTSIGPTGGNIHSISVSPDYGNDKTIFIGTDSGVFKSTNGGTKWRALPEKSLKSVEPSPNFKQDKTLLGGNAFSTNMLSKDGGRTWLEIKYKAGFVFSGPIAFSPNYKKDKTLFLGGLSEIAISTDEGLTWQALTKPEKFDEFDEHPYVPIISPNYSNDKTIFATKETAKLFRSENAGSNWQLNVIGSLAYINTIALSPDFDKDKVIYAGGNGVFISLDGGNSWRKSGLDRLNVLSIRISPGFARDKTVFARTVNVPSQAGANSNFKLNSEIYRSDDMGKTWTKLGLSSEPALESFPLMTGNTISLSPDFFRDNTVFAIADNKIFKSSNKGKTWKNITSNIRVNKLVTTAAISPTFEKDQTVFALTGDNKLYKTSNGGQNWRTVASGSFRALVLSPNFSNDNTLLAYDQSNIFKSTDGSRQWEQKTNDYITVQKMIFSPNFAQDKTVFFIGFQSSSGVYKSTDGGERWRKINNGLVDDPTSIGISPNYKKDGTLFVTTNDGLYKSTDHGEKWLKKIDMGFYDTSLVLSPKYGVNELLFVFEGNSTYKSTDGGKTLEKINNVPENIILMPNFPYFRNERELIVTTSNGEIFQSNNEGENWNIITNLPDVAAKLLPVYGSTSFFAVSQSSPLLGVVRYVQDENKKKNSGQ